MDSVIIIGLAFAFGGILKGATGVGAPILAVPVVAVFFDIPFAVTIFSLPNLLPNIWQAWAYRDQRMPWNFAARFAIAGGVGAAVGTFLLIRLPTEFLSLFLAGMVFVYIGFRLFQPKWRLGYPLAVKLALPIGLFAGALQGSSGLSAPASLTFLTAMRLERGQFMSTVSMFFVGLGVVQVPLLISYGMLNRDTALISAAAVMPLVAFMPVGARLARHISPEKFDRILLIILTILSLNLVVDFIR